MSNNYRTPPKSYKNILNWLYSNLKRLSGKRAVRHKVRLKMAEVK